MDGWMDGLIDWFYIFSRKEFLGGGSGEKGKERGMV